MQKQGIDDSIAWYLDCIKLTHDGHSAEYHHTRTNGTMFTESCQMLSTKNSLWKQRSQVLVSWWRHQMETFSALLVFCAENSPTTGQFPAQRPVTQSFDVLFDLPEPTIEQTMETPVI